MNFEEFLNELDAMIGEHREELRLRRLNEVKNEKERK